MCYEQEIEETDRQLLTASFTCPSFLLFPCDGQVEAVVTAREETIVPAATECQGLFPGGQMSVRLLSTFLLLLLTGGQQVN